MSNGDLENTLKNMISRNLNRSTNWVKYINLKIREHNSYDSKIFSLSSLNINNINDLVEKAMPSIYYMFSCLQDYFNNSENVEIPLKDISVSSNYVPDDHIVFFAKIYFFNEFEEGKLHPLDEKSKLIVKLKFKFVDLIDDENALTIIKTHIKEELEKSYSDINFNTDFIKIETGHVIDHHFNFSRVVRDYYAKLKQYRSIKKKNYIN